ncbi:MAG: 30S ribosomal protein S6 [Bacillota bacterium]|nr:30S ribosomal protein S6 [Bacillota bacterium]NLU53923.1 30S ribosomal protein S6 [Bacillota bacterium]HOA91578.1 30S ribosomal protein S6 [Bacillota bacterium]HOJ46874.1 30S ribosomal protein S6 [Bacillota bacterium]HOP53573.1 30S ribosomal protein S6 [Bacillota bacterium]
MRNYEMMYILNPTVADQEETLVSAIEKVNSLVTGNGGEIVNEDRWGKRRFQYEINKIREGYYVVLKFKLNPESLDELNRVLKLNEDIVRYLLINDEN